MGIIYHKVPDGYLETYDGYFDLGVLRKKHNQQGNTFKLVYAREHPVTFAYFMLGITVRAYQCFAIDIILANPRVALDWARRLGKTFVFCLLSFWLSYFDKEPKNSVENFTEIGLVSKEDRASKKLLASTRHLINAGDMHMYKKLGGVKDYFSRHLIEPNNTEQLTWNNNSKVVSLPPTKKVKGYGFSRLFPDELAYIEPKDDPDAETFYTVTMKPTVADTDGSICISSTPHGQFGLFYELFDPDQKYDSEYIGIWFNWKVNKDNPKYHSYVMSEKQRLLKLCRYNYFLQEFMGDFTVTQNSFYELEDVTGYFDVKQSSHYEWKKSPCSLGLDYGVSKCPCVATIKTKYRGKVITLYQRVYPVGYDINELMNAGNDDSIQGFMRRYDLAWIVPDDCPSGDQLNRWMSREGFPVEPYSFQAVGDKNRAYYKHRALLKTGVMVSYPLELLRSEMQGLQEELLKKYISIGKPSSGTDDAIDSDVFASIPFFDDDDSTFTVSALEPIVNPEQRDKNNRLVDSKWEALRLQGIKDIEEYNKNKLKRKC